MSSWGMGIMFILLSSFLLNFCEEKKNTVPTFQDLTEIWMPCEFIQKRVNVFLSIASDLGQTRMSIEGL